MEQRPNTLSIADRLNYWKKIYPMVKAKFLNSGFKEYIYNYKRETGMEKIILQIMLQDECYEFTQPTPKLYPEYTQLNIINQFKFSFDIALIIHYKEYWLGIYFSQVSPS